MKRFIKWTSLLLVLSTLLLCVGCSKAPSIMDSGAEQFAAGKQEDNYYLKNSGLLLDELLDKYSGSYYVPISVQIDVDDDPTPTEAPDDPTPTEAPDDTDNSDETTPPDEDEESDVTEPTEPPLPTAGSWEDLLDIFYAAYYASSEHLSFELVNGYTIDLGENLNLIYSELQRRDPIYVCGVNMWWWSVSGNTYSVDIDYNYDLATLIDMKEQTSSMVDNAVAQIDTAGKSDYELICAVNEYLCDLVYYPPNEPYAPVTHTAYGAFQNGVVVCEGYACAAKLMLNELGIRCDIQVGECTNGEGHAWNLVELDGQWYQLDVCWNDGGDREAFLLVSDAYMHQSRTWDASLYPACPSMYDHP